MSNLKRYSYTDQGMQSDNELGIYGGEFVKFDDIKEFLPTDVQQSKAGSEDSAQISAFVNWVAGLSKIEYAAHEQLVCVINAAQKLLPC